jgi:hypothetical protein
MGDAKVPDLAQLAHQHTLREDGLLGDDAWILYGRPPPTGLSCQSVYMYDHVAITLYGRASCRGPRSLCLASWQGGVGLCRGRPHTALGQTSTGCRERGDLSGAAKLTGFVSQPDRLKTSCAKCLASPWQPCWRAVVRDVFFGGWQVCGFIAFWFGGRTCACCRRPLPWRRWRRHGDVFVCRRRWQTS